MKQLTLPALLVGLSALAAFGQTVTTIATATVIDDYLIFDLDGGILGSHYNGSAVRKLAPDGTTTIYSDGYSAPNGMAFSSDSILYLADNTGNKIYRVFPDGSSQVFVNYPSPSGLLFEHDSDTLLATSYLGNMISKIAPDGTITHIFTGGSLNGPVSLCYDDDHNLYIANFNNARVFKVGSAGTLDFFAQPVPGGWLGFMIYAKGYLYATLMSANKIYRIDLQGNGKVLLGSTAGTVDGDASVAKFNQPNGILASTSGDTLYVSDHQTQNIRMITNLQDSTISATEQQMLADGALDIFPNPVSENVNLEMNLARGDDLKIFLLDASGQELRQLASGHYPAGRQVISLNLPPLPSGVYVMVVQFADGSTLSRKMFASNLFRH